MLVNAVEPSRAMLRERESALGADAFGGPRRLGRARLRGKTRANPGARPTPKRPCGPAASPQHPRHTGACRFVRSGAERDHLARRWELVQAIGDLLRRDAQRAARHLGEGKPRWRRDDVQEDGLAGGYLLRGILRTDAVRGEPPRVAVREGGGVKLRGDEARLEPPTEHSESPSRSAASAIRKSLGHDVDRRAALR